ncbi:MAG TPA: outer membrane beta-barrel protein [Vicinamibacterales bacterium]|nr:outer membrane beta-barrel protein [Vicinamibacterales bacterium]
MAGSRVAVIALVFVCAASRSEAQSFNFTGILTGHLGVAATNDVRGATVTAGASMGVLDDNGVGAELDVAHLGGFDSARFADSSVTSAMLTVIAVRQHPTLRPFAVVGAGVMNVRVRVFDGDPSVGRTEPGWTAGGGVLYMLNEILGIRGEARYFRHFSQHADVPLTGDGVLDFWRTSVGVTLAWPIR